MAESNEGHPSLSKIVGRILRFAAIAVSLMAVILVIGWFAGGPYWIAAIVLCLLVYVMLAARAAVFRHKLARWRSRNAADAA